MKKLLLFSMFLVMSLGYAFAQKGASIKFDKTVVNLGEFPETKPVQKCSFTFKNVGDAPLVINQVIATCGCTTASYPKKPIAPGEKGVINITYNGKGKFPGYFKKTVTVRTNGTPETVRAYLEGTMKEAK